MKSNWTAILVILEYATVYSVWARVCFLGMEPDKSSGGKVRFVLPPGDPCGCTEFKLGGNNKYAPPRPDPVVYIDVLPASAEAFRSFFGCNVEDAADCQAILDAGHATSGVYTIYRDEQPVYVYCRMDSGQGYIVFQRRINGSESFDRGWQEYADGFGSLEGEFWLGNEKLRQMTDTELETWELVITLTSSNNEVASVRYDMFSITGDNYALDVSGYQDPTDGGILSAGDALSPHSYTAFTTRDRDNDNSGRQNCAVVFEGGWWFKMCNSLQSNLNGVYNRNQEVDYTGIQWVTWKGYQTPLRGCEMKMRRNPSLP